MEAAQGLRSLPVMEDNPYQPPSQEAALQPNAAAFSEEGIVVVNSLSRWMSVVGMFYLLAAGMMVLGLVVTIGAAGNATVVVLAMGISMTLLVGLAGVWLREAGDQFSRGVMADDEGLIGAGFRTLKKYLMLFGILALLILARVFITTVGGA